MNEIAHGAGPGLVGVAAHIGVNSDEEPSGVSVPQIQPDIENQVGDFLYDARYFQISIKLLRQLHVTTAASLQIALMRRSINGRDVDHLKFAGPAQFVSQLVTGPLQSVTIVRAQPARRVLKAGIDHLQIEHGKPGRLGCAYRRQARQR